MNADPPLSGQHYGQNEDLGSSNCKVRERAIGAIICPRKDRKIRKVLLGAICLLALPMPGLAGEISCNGYQYGMQTRNVITLDINNTQSPKCELSLKASRNIKKWCNPDNFCTFRGRVARRSGNYYVVERITGGKGGLVVFARRPGCLQVRLAENELDGKVTCILLGPVLTTA